ncbi:hypothetical protein [Aquimarina rhabdastrellae]
MGTYWNGIKTKFSEIDCLKTKINELDFDYLELSEHPASQELNFSIKTTQLIKLSTPVDYATKHLSPDKRKLYNTFFYHTIWTTYDDQDELFIDKTKYTKNLSNDDLGWLTLDTDLYWKAFNTASLELIVKDYDYIAFDVLKELYELERSAFKKQLESYPDFNPHEYNLETKEIFSNFVTLTKDIIAIYKNCVAEKKDLIIEFI